MKPNVSIILPVYNNEDTLHETIESIIKQTYKNWELVITDDGSSDSSYDLISNIAKKDDRIKFYQHKNNLGISIASNNCITNSNGNYIAIIGADDLWHEYKLEQQVVYLNANPEISTVFTRTNIIDHNGNEIKNHFIERIFATANNKTRFEWLAHFFFQGNCLCTSSAIVRKKTLDSVGFFNPGLLGLQDYDLWIRICMKYDIKIMDDKLTYYRIRENNKNISARTTRNTNRNYNEHQYILNNYKKINIPSDVMNIFPDCSEFSRPELSSLYISLQAIKSKSIILRSFGVNALLTFLENQSNIDIMYEYTNFSMPELFNLIAEAKVYITKNTFIPFIKEEIKGYIKEIF